MLQVQRFLLKIESALVHGLHGHPHRAVAGNDDYRGAGQMLLHVGQKLLAAGAGHVEVSDDQVEAPLFQHGDGRVPPINLGHGEVVPG